MRRAMTIVGSLLLFVGVVAPSAVGRTVPLTSSRPVLQVVPSVRESWPGGVVTYTIVVRNRGNGARLTARLAGGLSVVQISDPGCSEVRTGLVTCALPEMARGADKVRVVIAAVVRPGVAGRLRTVVAVGAARAVVVTMVRGSTDLSVRLRLVHRGSRTDVISATVGNRGPRAARRVILRVGTYGGEILHYRGARCTGQGRVRCRLGRMGSGAWRMVWFTVPSGTVLAAVVEPERGDLRPADNTALVP